MGLFSKKETRQEKRDKLMEVAAKVTLHNAEKRIHEAVKNSKIIFLSDDRVTYTNRAGNLNEYTIDGLAEELYRIFDEQYQSINFYGNSPSFALIGVTTQDIKELILKERK